MIIKNIAKYKNNLLFIPLGGVNEIGMNVNLYHYKGQWIIVDCGTCFSNDIKGVKIIYPNLEFIQSYKNDVLALFITHAHEDHVGGAIYLWERIKCPIYTTLFTSNFLRKKIENPKYSKEIKINVINSDSKFSLGNFEIETASLTHSAPEMQSLMIKTEVGNIFHTGDWKFDQNPTIGPASNKKLLRQFRKENILALVCDSTNSHKEGKDKSEGELQNSLVKLVKEQENMILITTFASNIGRVATLLICAKKNNRKIVLVGKSIHRIFSVAKESGYFKKEKLPEIISDKNMKKYKRSELMVISTGCQGEENAALRLITEQKHNVKLKKNDTVIFSSKIIPGNEKKISEIVNKLILQGIKVINEKDEFVHVSGHPFEDDLKEMYNIIQPQVSIPVHGETFHIHKHANLAKRLNIKTVIQTQNGDIVKIASNNTQILGKVKSGYIGLDGKNYIDTSSDIFKIRKILSDSGAIFVNVILDLKNKKITKFPIISAPGILDLKKDKELIQNMQNNITKLIKDNFRSSNLSDNIKTYVKKLIKKERNKFPHISVILSNINLTCN